MVQVMQLPTPFPGPILRELRDRSGQRHDTQALKRHLADDGYLFLRDMIPREAVLASRRMLVDVLGECGLLVPGSDPMETRAIVPTPRGGPSPHRPDITDHKAFRGVVEHPVVFDLFARLLGGDVMTFKEKWLRVTPPGAHHFTGAHMDIVYMGAGTQNLLTCWIPHGDVPVEHGPVAIIPESHRDPAFARIRETYGKSDVDRDGTEGWFSRDASELAARSASGFATADFRAGDLVLFGMFTMHCSCANLSDRIRLSSDTRYQRSDEPFDPRWYGPHATGHTKRDTPPIPMQETRRIWGV